MSPKPPPAEGYELTLLLFFRDLVERERLKILVDLDAIPANFDERMTQRVERMLFDWLVSEGRLPEIIVKLEELTSERREGEHE